MLTSLALSLASCGGLFCSQASPTPVDQRAERILFEVLDDGSVSATVEIRYEGDPREFSWVVPVTGTPEFVDVAPKDTLALLDAATAPQIIPPSTICSNPPFNGFACTDRLYAGFPSAAEEGEGEGVDVTAYPSVGPFDEIVVVEGTNPNVLMSWLGDHGYQVTDGMRPFIEEYTVEGYKFLASKLAPDAEVKDMVPIRFHCPQPFPEIPLRLTAIAAEPEMGFTVFVAGAGRYTPSNYAEVSIQTKDIQTSGGLTNYFALISKRIDEEGGLGYVVEGALGADTVKQRVDGAFIGTDGEEEARTHLDGILSERQFVTRFYGRMSPEEMVEDPVFIPRADASFKEFNGTFDLSSRTIDACPADGDPQPVTTPPVCGLLYCGDGDGCAGSADDGDGCVCRGTHLARVINGPNGGFQVACASPDIDVHGAADSNPCASTSCGDGQCLPVNDRATCKCDEGAVAVLAGNQVRCVQRTTEVFEPDQILWPSPDVDLAGGGGCTGAHVRGGGGGFLSVALFVGAVAGMRRLLRRRR